LARNDSGAGNGWVHQAAGAAGGAISTSAMPEAPSSTGLGPWAIWPAAPAVR
jgi:hypothetical protein